MPWICLLKQRQKKFLKRLNLSISERHIINVARDFGFSKAYRKDIEYHANYAYHIILEEIGRRFYFTAHQGHYLSPAELISIIKGKERIDVDLINQRIKHCVYLVKKIKKGFLLVLKL